ncbi:hypothetical protein C8J57DRAFT_1464500 [Mycena rebaudengoi]|nr:hypothetical protein C8J57DRAFT_1464500 [Mycena rebaudengoi]
MPRLEGNTILSSDDGPNSPMLSPSLPNTHFGAYRSRSTTPIGPPLPSLNRYLFGSVGLLPATPSRRRSESLPGSSPVYSPSDLPHPLPPTEKDDPAAPIPRHLFLALPPLSSDDLIISSPVIGTKEQQQAKRRGKGQKQRAATLANNRVTAKDVSEEHAVAVFDEILTLLKDNDLTFGQLMLYVFDPNYNEAATRWDGFFKEPGLATKILNLWVSKSNSRTAREEVGAWAEGYIEEIVRDEGEDITASKVLQTGREVVTNDYVTGFSMLAVGAHIQQASRVAMKILSAFATSPRNLRNNLPQRAAKRFTLVTSTALALLGEFSHKNNFSRRIMALYLYATGAQRQTISVMSHLGISESYQSLTHKERIVIDRRRRRVEHDEEELPQPPSTPSNSPPPFSPLDAAVLSAKMESLRRTKLGTLQELSSSMRNIARGIASTGLFAASYDNINMMFRAAEQVIGRTDSQENGTCATIFPLWQAAVENMRIADLNAAFNTAPPLSITDVLLTVPELALMDKCLRHCILRIIVEHGGEKFAKFRDELDKVLPVTADKIELHRTPLHPLPAGNIDESTIIGNSEVVDAIYNELQIKGLSHWKWVAKILAGDQLSIARLRSLLNIRAGHEGAYTGFGWGIWMPGLFHGKIADMHGFFVTHWGVPHRGTRNPGSLSFHNTHLHRAPIVLTSLPPFRVCRDLVFVSLYARILHCLLLVSGTSSLDECADSITSFAQLETYAGSIQTRYANAELVADLRWQREMAAGTEGLPPGDHIFENASLFLRDALISREFTDSIKAGDSGRIVLVLKLLALSFRGNGRTKYAYEMLHLIHNLTHVWPKPIRDIILKNWLVNPTGKPFSWVEVDLMQEHMNFWIKTIYKAHGSAASWEWLGMVAPCVTALRHLSTSIINILGSDQGTKHAPADLVTDIEVLMESLAEHEVYEIKGRVFAEGDGAPTPDVITAGIHQLTDSTSNPLTEYNTSFQKLQARCRLKPLVESWDDGSITSPSPPPSPTPPPSPPAVPGSVPPQSPMDLDPLPLPDVPTRQDLGRTLTPEVFMRDGSEAGESDAEDDGTWGDEELTSFERAMDEVDEPTLTCDSVDDVALDMDGGDSGFIFSKDLHQDDGIFDLVDSGDESDNE